MTLSESSGREKVDFPYVYRWNRTPMRPLARKGQRCRIVSSGKMSSVLIEFEDGFQVVTSLNAVRRAQP